MGVVRSISDKTARASVDLPDIRARFVTGWKPSRAFRASFPMNDHNLVTFDELIETELRALGGEDDRVRLRSDGPDARHGAARVRYERRQMGLWDSSRAS